MNWTEERVERLKKLWAEGLSASQIAADLGGVTRNAVIGKVHRLGLSGRAKPARTSAPRPRKQRPVRPMRSEPTYASYGNAALKVEMMPVADVEPEVVPLVIETLEVPPEERKTILELTEYTCKWPVGDPSTEDFYFCGRKSSIGLPYCEHHSRVAYQPLNDRRRERRAAAKLVAGGRPK